MRDTLISARKRQGLHEVSHSTAADTIYSIDTEVEPILEEFCREWSKTLPMVLIAEGIEADHGQPEGIKVFPEGTREEDAVIRLIVDPIDGTRGIMYDKRPAWALAGIALNKGKNTRLSDIFISVMTELPTSKMGYSDVLWAIKGQGAFARRDDLRTGTHEPLTIGASTATTIKHGFATVSNFFPGTKVLSSQLMEHIVENSIGKADITKAMIFDDQYISTGGQFYELIIGHDRFICDLRSLFYKKQGQEEGLCVHPYDCASFLVATEAGVILTDWPGQPTGWPTGLHHRIVLGRICQPSAPRPNPAAYQAIYE